MISARKRAADKGRTSRHRALAGTLAFCLFFVGANEALAHATLLSSEPKSKAVLSLSPPRIRLVFSEPVVAELSQIELLSAVGPPVRLQVSGDPRDVHALVALPALLAPGAYRVVWRVVSADGHPVGGDFVFTVAGAAGANTFAPAPPPPHYDELSHEDASGPTAAGAPIVPSLLRGAALASMLGLTGLLMFGLKIGRAGGQPPRALKVSLWLAVAAAILFTVHLAMWLVHATPADQLTQSWLGAATGNEVGRMEIVRVILAVLAVWALALARRPAIALFFAAACLMVSGAIGHSAAIAPALAVPSKALHLLSIAIWLGGLLWLIIADRGDEAAFIRDCHRVSAIALWAVILTTITGSLQSFLFLGGLSRSLVISAYGAFVAAKIAGLLVLVAFGAYHRRTLMPAMDSGAPSVTLRRSVRTEALVFIAVVFVGGVMAYVPTPSPRTEHITQSGER